MDYGWKKTVKEAKPKPVFEVKVHLCNECYDAKFPFGVIYNGRDIYCPHLFARKAKEEL